MNQARWRTLVLLVVAMTAYSVADAQEYKDCLPSRYLETQTTGPFSIDEIAYVRAKIAQAKQMPDANTFLDETWGVGFVQRSYAQCMLRKVPEPHLTILKRARELDRDLSSSSLIDFAVGKAADLIPDHFTSELVGGIPSIPFKARKEVLQKLLQGAIADAWKADGQLNPVRVAKELNTQIAATGALLSDDAKSAVSMAAFEALIDVRDRSPENFEKAMLSLAGSPETKLNNSVANGLKAQSALSESDRTALWSAQQESAKLRMQLDATTDALKDTLVVSSQAIEKGVNAVKFTDKQVQEGLEVWLGERPELRESPANMRKFALEQIAAGGTEELNLAGANALLEVADLRLSAQSVQTKAANAVGALNVLAAGLQRVDPMLARYAAAGAQTAQAVSEIAGIVAKGAMGPIGWLSIAGSLMNLGDSLGGIFGGGGPDAAALRHEEIMNALSAISQQISELRDLVANLDERQRRTLELQSLYQEVLLERSAEDIEAQGYQQCQAFVRAIDRKSVATATQLVASLTEEEGAADLSALARKCRDWLIQSGGNSIRSVIDAGSLNSWFKESTKVLDTSIMSALSSDDRPLVLAEIRKSREVFASLRRLFDAANSDSPNDMWSLLLEPSSTWSGSAKRRLAALSEAKPPPDLGRRLQLLGRIGAPLFRTESVLSNAVAVPRALVVMRAASSLANVNDIFEDSVGGMLRYAPSGSGELQVANRKQADRWLREWAGLALAAMGSESLLRGEHVVPIIHALLAFDRSEAVCQSEPKPNPKDLCERYGASKLQSLVRDAKTAIRNSAELRANLAVFRVRELLGSAGEFAGGTRDEPSYSSAFEAKWVGELERLLPGIEIFALPPSANSAFADPLEADSRWFMRLSGRCAGLKERAFNARAICNGIGCGEASLTKNEVDIWSIRVPADEEPADLAKREEWSTSQSQICLLAPLPTGKMLESGALYARASFHRTVAASQSFLKQTAYYYLYDKKSTPDRLFMGLVVKPPFVSPINLKEK